MSSAHPKPSTIPWFRLGFGGLFLAIAFLQLHWFVTNPWMSIRLAPAFEFARGNPIYPTPEGGPYVSTLYGFVAPLFYAPFAWIMNADWALRFAGIWSCVWTVGAGLVVLNQGLTLERNERRFLLALFALTAWAIPSLRYGLWEIHADAPAHVLVLVVCYSVVRHLSDGRTRWLILAGVAAGTAPWAKQTIIICLLGPILYLWLVRGFRAVATVVGTATATGLLWFAVGALLYRADVLWFNLFTVPGKHPWVLEMSKGVQMVFDLKGKLLAVARLFTRNLVWFYGPLALLLTGLTIVLRKAGDSDGKSFLRSYPTFAILLFTAIFAVPASVLGLVKAGGDVNSAAFAVYPALLALFAGVGNLVPMLRDRKLAEAGAALAFVAMAVLALCAIAERAYLATWPSHSALEQFMKRHPGEVYCPSDPLVHVVTANACPPIGDVVLSMNLAGQKVSRAQFEAAYPGGARFKYVVYPHFNSGEGYISELFPEYSESTVMPELPGLRVMTKPSSAGKTQ